MSLVLFEMRPGFDARGLAQALALYYFRACFVGATCPSTVFMAEDRPTGSTIMLHNTLQLRFVSPPAVLPA